MEGLPISYILFPVAAFFGFLMRRLFVKLEQTMAEPEIRQLIKDRLDPVYVKQASVDHELARIEHKLDKILDLLINGKK